MIMLIILLLIILLSILLLLLLIIFIIMIILRWLLAPRRKDCPSSQGIAGLHFLIYIYIYIHVYMYVSLSLYIYIYIGLGWAYIYIYMYTYIYIYTYTHIPHHIIRWMMPSSFSPSSSCSSSSPPIWILKFEIDLKTMESKLKSWQLAQNSRNYSKSKG